MARKKEPTIIHPVQALEALKGYNEDVNYLLMMVHSATTFMRNPDVDAQKLRTMMPDQLEEAAQRVRRWYQGED